MSEQERWQLRLPDYEAALANLELATQLQSERALTIIEQAGLIQLFEIAWELGWKLMRDRLSALGMSESISSPVGAVRIAFAQGLIDNGQAWIDAGKLRNTLLHEYHPDRAANALKVIGTRYLPMFKALEASVVNDRHI